MLQVLRTLATPQNSKPFAINQQYKSNMKSKNEETSDAMVVVDPAEQPVEPPRKKQKTKNGKAPAAKSSTSKKGKVAGEKPSTSTTYTPHKYNEKRLEYIQKMRDDGSTYSEAVSSWNSSPERGNMLKCLSVGELIRRRFVPKGSTTNPWL